MTVTCATLPKDINRDYAELSQKYIKEGKTVPEARKQAAQDFIDVLNTFGSTQNTSSNHVYTDVLNEIIRNKDDLSSIYRRLGFISQNNKTDSQSHSNTLSDLMDTLIYPLVDRLGTLDFQLKESDTLGSAFGKINTTLGTIRIAAAKNPFLNGLHLSLQEILAHEMVHAVTASGYTSGPLSLRKGVESLYELAKSKLTPDDFSETVNNQLSSNDANKERYDYIFNNTDGKGPYEFIAFGLTNENFRNKLDSIKLEKNKSTSTTLLGKVVDIFNKIVDYITNRVFHIKGDTVGSALWELSQEISGLKEKQQNLLDYLSNGFEMAKGVSGKAIDLAIKPITDWANDPKGKPNTIRTSILIWQNWSYTPIFGKFYLAIAETANNIIKHREFFLFNLIQKLPQELLGQNALNENWAKLLQSSRNVIDGERYRMKEAVIKYVRDTIGPLDDDRKRALTQSIIYTDLDDLQTYNPSFTLADYRKVLSDDAEVARRIKEDQIQLRTLFGLVADGYIRQAIGLGMFMVTKETINDNQMRNAFNIAEGFFDSKFVKPANWQDAIPIIQRLKTLHALQFTKKEVKALAVEFFDSQSHLSVDKENGFNNLLSLNLGFKKQSLEKLFKGETVHTVAGYVKDLNVPDVMLKVSNKKNDQALMDQGFIMVEEPLGQDPKVPSDKHYMYVATHSGLVPYVKMITSMTSRQVAGTTLTDLYVTDGMSYKDALDKAEMITDSIKFQTSGKSQYSKKMDLTDTKNLVPILNGKGEIIEYSYVMSEAHRIKYLGKDTRIDNVLGYMYESITDKDNTIDINQQVVKELIKEHKNLYPSKPKGFITVTKNHPKYGEIYQILPKEMKRELDIYFGKGKIVVRESMMDIIFGYRKYSLFAAGDNSWVSRVMKNIIIDILKVSPGKYYRYGRATEQGLQELVAQIKKTIVLKTPVFAFNILSNAVISLMHGMPLNYLLKNQGEATIAVEDYIKKHRTKLILEKKLDTIGASKDTLNRYKAEIARLELAMKNSPIKPLIDEGLLNSIVEDVTIDDSEFGIKGDLINFVVSKTKWIPKPVKVGYSYLQIGPQTGLYKVLEKATRYSDFIARHAMYKWYIEEKKIPKEEALKIVTETFINYDLPTSAELLYLNDMGFYMFTKYALRVQKTLYRLFRDNPKSIIALGVMEGMFGNITDPTDSLDFLGLPRNPIGSIDELVAPLYNLAKDMIP